MLSEQKIKEFQEIYLKTYGEKLSFFEAAKQASQLLRFYKAVLKIPLVNKRLKEASHG